MKNTAHDASGNAPKWLMRVASMTSARISKMPTREVLDTGGLAAFMGEFPMVQTASLAEPQVRRRVAARARQTPGIIGA